MADATTTKPKRGRATADAKRAATRAASEASAVPPAKDEEPVSAPARGRKRAATPVEPEPAPDVPARSKFIAGLFDGYEPALAAAHAAVAVAEAKLVDVTATAEAEVIKAEQSRDRLIAMREALEGHAP